MSYGEQVRWEPATPRIGLARLIVSWLIGAAAVWVASAVLPGVSLEQTGAAFLVAAVVALMNAMLPPLLAALRLPLMLVTGFVLLLLADAFVLWAAHEILPDDIRVDSFGDAFLAAILIAAVSLVLQVVLGTNDDDRYNLSVTRRIARRQGAAPRTDVPGIVFLEIDGLALPVLRDAMRDGSAPALARWIADDGYRLVEWETDLSSQTGASQAGILLGSNEDIPAFRWVEKAEGRLVACSAPGDCAEIERKRATGAGLLVNGGTSRGNLLSGEADETILTVSRTDAERGANPGYRAFFANGFNVTRTLVLMGWEIGLEVTAATRAATPRHPPARAPRRRLPAPARGDVRARPRPERLQRPDRHDARAAGRVRDLRELRRGRAPLRARARGHAGGAAQARPAVRPHRARPPLRAAAVRDRGALRPRPDAGRHVQAAPRLRPGRARGALPGPWRGHRRRRRRRAGDGRGDRGQRGDRAEAEEAPEERRLGPRGRRAGLGEPRPGLPDGGAAPAHPRGDRRAPSEARPRPPRPPARRLAAGALGGARRARAGRPRQPPARERPDRGRGPARRLLPDGAAAPAAHGRLLERGRHHDRELLRPHARRGLRVRGADLLPRRARRPADPRVRPGPAGAAAAGRAPRRRGGRARAAGGLAAAPPGRRAGAGRRLARRTAPPRRRAPPHRRAEAALTRSTRSLVEQARTPAPARPHRSGRRRRACGRRRWPAS